MRSGSGAAVLAVAAAFLAACGGGASAPGGVEVVSASGELVVADAWIRPTPPVSNVGAFYLTIRNDGAVADEVVGASAPRCAEIEIHQTETIDGVASMGEAAAEQLTVAPGGSLAFEPSGLHVMCLGLDEPVASGDQLTLTVELGRAGPLTIEAVAENR